MSICNALIIEPPSPPAAGEFPQANPVYTDHLAPPWNPLCLRAFLLKHTRHHCTVLDLRLSADPESSLAQAIAALPAPRVVIVHTTSLGLGPAMGVVEMTKRQDADVCTVLFGQHPSQFPGETAALPRFDYALCGDPEPILRNLLDYLDLPQRLARIPGLITPGNAAPAPCWLPHLRAVTPPDWEGIFWQAYHIGVGRLSCQATLRVSRGSPKTDAARFADRSHEPLRSWPMRRLAPMLDKAAPKGVTEVVVTDPPAFWTEARLSEWTDELVRSHSTMPWSLQLYPAILPEDLVEKLEYSGCDHITFTFPSPFIKTLRSFWAPFSWEQLAASFDRLREAGIAHTLEFWLGGPHEERGHDEAIQQAIRQLGEVQFRLRPYPFGFDLPLYREAEEAGLPNLPTLDAWQDWAKSPWTHNVPTALWEGAGQEKALRRRMNAIQRGVARNPFRRLARTLSWFRPGAWITAMERRTSGYLPPN